MTAGRACLVRAGRAQSENVLIGLDGHIKLADFGTAKQMRGRVQAAAPPPTNHSLIGTPEYMAPEVLLGRACCETSDWWSFGCIGYELLVGVTPFSETEQGVEDLVRRVLYVALG